MGRSERGEAGGPCGGVRPPSNHATSRSTLMAAVMATCCKWVFVNAPIPRAPQPKGSDPLREGPFDPCPARIRGVAGCTRIPCPRGVHGLVLLPGREHQATGLRFRTGAQRARADTPHSPSAGTSPECRAVLRCVTCSVQDAARLPWGQWASWRSQSIVNWSTTYAPATWVCQPGSGGWTAQGDAMLRTTGDQQFGIDIGRIHQMLRLGELLVDQLLMNDVGTHGFVDGGGGRVDIGEQMRCGGLAGFADMDHIAGPRGLVFVAVPCVDIVGRFEAFGGPRQLLVRLEAHVALGRWPRGGSRRMRS